MGRLSRYKKTKSFDPFCKGNKQNADAHLKKSKNTQKSQKVNQSQGIEEQTMPRSMKMLIERAKKMKTKKKKKLKRLDEKQSTNKTISFERRKDENQKDYFQRIDREAATAVMESMKKQKKMSDRRKNHLKKRKEKIKTQKNPERIFKASVEFTDLKDNVKFGEVVEQPPVLTAKPRKAAETQDKDKKSLLLNSKLSSNEKTPKSLDSTPKKSKNVLAKTKKRKHMSESEKAIMDKERLRVIEMYRTAKKKAIANKR